MAQQETLKVLAGLAKHPTRRSAGPDKVTHCFMCVVRYPKFRQLAGPVQLRERHRIAAVGLHSVAGSTRD